MDEVDEQMSTWKPDSALMRLNADPVGDWIEVPARLADVLHLALEIGRASGGAFDIGVGDAVGAWGFGPHAADRTLIQKALATRHDTLTLVVWAILAYGALQLLEGVGLWMLKRWGEYVAVVGTSLFIPVEVHELLDRVTVLRVLALAVNLFAVGYLLWTKRLFGLRGGRAAFEAERQSQSLIEVEQAAIDAELDKRRVRPGARARATAPGGRRRR